MPYPRLRKPRYQPPAQAFPVVWTLLYGDIAVSSAATIDRLNATDRSDEARAYVRALGVNLVLNASWSWLFFNRHRLKTCALAAAALAVSSADLVRRAAFADDRAALMLGLYPTPSQACCRHISGASIADRFLPAISQLCRARCPAATP